MCNKCKMHKKSNNKSKQKQNIAQTKAENHNIFLEFVFDFFSGFLVSMAHIRLSNLMYREQSIADGADQSFHTWRLVQGGGGGATRH